MKSIMDRMNQAFHDAYHKRSEANGVCGCMAGPNGYCWCEHKSIEAGLLAALAILREPTLEMQEAGARAATADFPERVDQATPYDDCDNLFRMEWRGEVSASFRAMLGAAFKDS